MSEDAEFMTIEDLRKMCDDKDLVPKILVEKDLEEQLRIIMENCSDQVKKINVDIAKSYISNLKDQSNNFNFKIYTDENGLPTFLEPLDLTKEKTEDVTENSSIKATESGNPPKGKKSTDSKKLKKEPNSPDASESVSEVITEEKLAVLIKNSQAKSHEEIAKYKNEHEKTIKDLQAQVKTLTDDLSEYMKSNNSNIDQTSQSFSTIIRELNDLLNSNDEKITVQINRELLSKATKFVDKHSLIKLESIIRQGNDLSSTIVQSILLAFIHDKSFF